MGQGHRAAVTLTTNGNKSVTLKEHYGKQAGLTSGVQRARTNGSQGLVFAFSLALSVSTMNL
jgi:hypothetical protein